MRVESVGVKDDSMGVQIQLYILGQRLDELTHTEGLDGSPAQNNCFIKYSFWFQGNTPEHSFKIVFSFILFIVRACVWVYTCECSSHRSQKRVLNP